MSLLTNRLAKKGVFAAVFTLLFAVAASAQVAVTTTALPIGATGAQYYANLAATGGTGPYTWTVTNGTLPNGLTLSGAGVITGTPAAVTAGAPPVADQFSVTALDTMGVSAVQTYRLVVLPPGSHSLVLNQIYTGAKGSASAPYLVDYVEAFNAGPVAIDLQNWTLQYTPATSDFTTGGSFPIGSLDPYHIGTTGGSDGAGSYPAFTITYSSSFAASNCNSATGTPVNASFPAAHCWLNPGQFFLVQIVPSGSTTPTTPQTFPLTPDLDISGGVPSNVGAVSGSTKWINHSGTTSAPNPSSGKFALVNSVNVAISCPTTNPAPYAAFSPKASDFIAYFAAGGSATVPTCWEGQDRGYYASSSNKNTQALTRAAGKGTVAGTALSTTATLTPCGDTDNNLTDFAPAINGSKGQANWVLHNGSQKVTASTVATPSSYVPAACPSLSNIGPSVTATVDRPAVGLNEGSGSVTETLTVTVTPAATPISELFNVSADLSGIAGASSAQPISSSTPGVPDASGNVVYQETFAMPTGTVGTFNVPVTVQDDAYRWASNASPAVPLQVAIKISASCQVPTAADQSATLPWNAAYILTLAGGVGANCSPSDNLVYTVGTQPAHGTLSAQSGSSITYTPAAGYSGLDSFTYSVADTTGGTGTLTSRVATVSLAVSAVGVTPTLTVSCPSVTYDGLPHSCTASTSPYVSGTTTITYAGSATLPSLAGTYAVAASFAASDPSQNASATGSLVIQQATPTLNLNCPVTQFDGSAHGCTATAMGVAASTVSGTTTITYNGSATQPSDGGTYAVQASFTSTDPDYTNATATGSLVISQPTVTITANDASAVYGAKLPALTYAISPSVPLTTMPVCTSSTTATTDVGVYTGAITCSGAAKVGINFVYVAGTMTITPATATVTATSQTMTMGTSVPTLTFTTAPAGVSFSKAPSCTTPADRTSAVGAYPITCTGGVSLDYTLNYTAGTLTVTTAANAIPVISGISVSSASVGGAAVPLTVSGTGFVSGAVVQWNGTNLSTTYVSSTSLTTTIPASDFSAAGVNSITVSNPAPGGGVSSPVGFAVNTAANAPGAFSMSVGTPTLTVVHGHTGSVQINFAGLASGANVSTTCYNLPLNTSCNYNNVTGTLTITTDTTTPAGSSNVLLIGNSGTVSALNAAPATTNHTGTWLALLLAPFGGAAWFWRRRRTPVLLAAFFVGVLLCMSGCSSGNSGTVSPGVVPAQSSTTMTLVVQ
ncbi:MAG TPA: MBG domain-containing protein [Acidobacteriaceae bacterium]|jgi:hypothetical protein